MTDIGSGKAYKKAQARLEKRQKAWDSMRVEDRKRAHMTKRPGSLKKS